MLERNIFCIWVVLHGAKTTPEIPVIGLPMIGNRVVGFQLMYGDKLKPASFVEDVSANSRHAIALYIPNYSHVMTFVGSNVTFLPNTFALVIALPALITRCCDECT